MIYESGSLARSMMTVELGWWSCPKALIVHPFGPNLLWIPA